MTAVYLRKNFLLLSVCGRCVFVVVYYTGAFIIRFSLHFIMREIFFIIYFLYSMSMFVVLLSFVFGEYYFINFYFNTAIMGQKETLGRQKYF